MLLQFNFAHWVHREEAQLDQAYVVDVCDPDIVQISICFRIFPPWVHKEEAETASNTCRCEHNRYLYASTISAYILDSQRRGSTRSSACRCEGEK
jgi:hypothetical protein